MEQKTTLLLDVKSVFHFSLSAKSLYVAVYYSFRMSTDFIKEIWASDELDIKDSVCDLTALFKNIRVLSSTSSSSTVQVLAGLTDKAKTYQVIKEYVERTGEDRVFVKVGFEEPGDNSADMERMIYKYLERLLFDCRTPNIMRYVAGFKCDNFRDFLTSRKGKSRDKTYHTKMLTRVEELEEREKDLGIDVNRAVIILVELGKGRSFRDMLEDEEVTEEIFTSVMFQTFYTLRELHLNKVRHNDIHLGNIWVNIHPTPQSLVYFVNDGMYAVLETRWVVKLYDFDRSGFTIGPITNEVLSKNFCPQFGMCENENERFDLLIVVSNLYQDWSTYPFVLDFVLNVVQNPDYLEEACCQFPGRYCDLKYDLDAGAVRCSSSAVIETNGIYNIEQLCEQTSVFDSYLRFLDTDGFEKRDLPISKPAKKTDVPMYTFTTNFYVSTACSLSPIQIANELLKRERAKKR